MIQLTRTRVVADDRQLLHLEEQFNHQQSVLLSNFFDDEVLGALLRQMDTAAFTQKPEGGEDGDPFGHVLAVPRTDPVLFLFQFLMNRPALFDVIRRVTGCDPIGNFVGRIHRTLAGSNHHIDWHGDNADHRLIGVTVNLGVGAHTGGAFQIRDIESARVLNEISNTRAGDAFLFRIGPGYQHRLLPVEIGTRTVGVGWVRSEPSWNTFARSFSAAVRNGRETWDTLAIRSLT